MGINLKIGGATVNQTPIDWAGNTANIMDAISAARSEHVEILCLPEMSIPGYGSEDLFLSEWVPERAWSELQKIKEACINITVAVGLPVRIGEDVYNGACMISDKRILGISLKQNLARDGVHYEPRWFIPWHPGEIIFIERDGEKIPVGDVLYEVRGISIGFEICEDAWRKDRPGNRLCQKGVQLILNPSASHFSFGKSELREQQVVIEGSGKFKCAYIFANLLGNEAGRMIYDGDIIIGQNGRLLAINNRLSFKNFNLLSCTIDFGDPVRSEQITATDGKEKNEEFARAASLALYDYLRKSRAKGFVLSLSGGADSSICAVLVSEMIRRASAELGWKKFCDSVKIPFTENLTIATGYILFTAYQGTRNSSESTLLAAKGLAESLGAKFYYWLIDDEIGTYSKTIEVVLGRPLSWDLDDIALQNIQARSRSPIIWLLANIHKAVLLTTSNRSEGDVGYATMDGDTSGSLAPIAGIDKVFIIQWLKWAETALGYSGLSRVNNLQPTAELRPLERAQTDEKDLMPYPVLLAIEKLGIRDRKTPTEVFHALTNQYPDKKLLRDYIRKFFTLWSANQWKRERLAPSFHFDDLNVDPRSWCRFPILSGGFREELDELEKIPL